MLLWLSVRSRAMRRNVCRSGESRLPFWVSFNADEGRGVFDQSVSRSFSKWEINPVGRGKLTRPPQTSMCPERPSRSRPCATTHDGEGYKSSSPTWREPEISRGLAINTPAAAECFAPVTHTHESGDGLSIGGEHPSCVLSKRPGRRVIRRQCAGHQRECGRVLRGLDCGLHRPHQRCFEQYN